jgi:hypothetical protein
LGIDRIATNAASSLVQVTRYQDPSEQPKLVRRIVRQRLKQRFRPRDIAVLSCRGMGSTALKDCARVGNHTLRRLTNEPA